MKKKFRRYRFFREGRKKVLHILPFPEVSESESQFWTVRGEIHLQEKVTTWTPWSIPRVSTPPQKKLCFLFLAGKTLLPVLQKRGHYPAHTCLEMVQILVANKEKNEKSPRKVSKDRNIHQPLKISKYPCERVPVYEVASGSFSEAVASKTH